MRNWTEMQACRSFSRASMQEQMKTLGRAMNKSFQESNGTVLSTNWKDIGAKKTEFKS